MAERSFSKAIKLIQKGKNKEALVELRKAEEAAKKAKANDILLQVQSTKGHLMQTLGAYEEALIIYFHIIKVAEEVLSKDPNDEHYKSILQINLEPVFVLGGIFHNIGNFIQAKNCFELHLSIYQKLLKIDPENLTYQSGVAGTINDLGNLLSDMGRIEEAKQLYEKALEIGKKLLKTDPGNVTYQSNVGGTLNTFGNLLRDMGRIEEAKSCMKKPLK
jgi:tetratricopeptide (TPR) repeat protein